MAVFAVVDVVVVVAAVAADISLGIGGCVGVVAAETGGDNVGDVDGLDVANGGPVICSVAALVSSSLPVFCGLCLLY